MQKTMQKILSDTQPLEEGGDLAAEMVDGIHRYLMRLTAQTPARRDRAWSKVGIDEKLGLGEKLNTVRAKRRLLLKRIGAQDQRPAVDWRVLSATPRRAELAGGKGYRVFTVRWTALEGLDGEGLLLEPDGRARSQVIALPDCDWTPEQLVGLTAGVPARAQYARRLAENGCRVLVPALVDRDDAYAGVARYRMTNQPHREYIYRAAFELGRHIIGFEIQKVLAAVDALKSHSDLPVGIMGYGEGGLLALYAAAVDERIGAAAISGYFRGREGLFAEPIYRNVFGLLSDFGDAEIAVLAGGRPLVVEACAHPQIDGPPPVRDGRAGAAPGCIETPPLAEVEAEVGRARKLAQGIYAKVQIECVGDGSGLPGSEAVLQGLLRHLNPHARRRWLANGTRPRRLSSLPASALPDAEARRKRQVTQMIDYTQRLLAQSEVRRQDFWAKADGGSCAAWERSSQKYRAYLDREVIGRLPKARLQAKPRSRLWRRTKKYSAYEVVLDVYPDVFAYGILLVPKGIKDGERRPVVVCQHGLEGRPQDVVVGEVPAYNNYAARLAERGYVVFAPQNPYIGEDRFRTLQRLANPLGLSLFSVITRQHERILQWLGGLSYVDAGRIAFYGLSYGGKTAMRVPALLDGYCLSICSADYNEWVWKNASARHRYSYLLTGEYEMPEFDLGNTFNYAEMSWLICPRPFMVERGHDDGVAPDEWVAYEFARTKRRYVKLGIGDRAEIAFFDGPHTIHGEASFRFLDKHLGWEGA
jgi:dienelactone hydrolase